MIGASPDENAFAGITARSSVARPTPTRISFNERNRDHHVGNFSSAKKDNEEHPEVS
jgi:hypothetical protein